MRAEAILVIATIGLLATPQASATRIACYGSNGERILATLLASADEQAVASLPAILNGVAQETNSTLESIGVFEHGSDEERKEFQMTDEHDRFVVTVTEASPTSVTLSVERACRSRTAKDWHSLWMNVRNRLEKSGFTFQ